MGASVYAGLVQTGRVNWLSKAFAAITLPGGGATLRHDVGRLALSGAPAGSRGGYIVAAGAVGVGAALGLAVPVAAPLALKVITGVAGTSIWEAAWAARRRARRGAVYKQALARARTLDRPLMVIGAPDSGSTAGYDCGDITVDINQSTCPRHIQADVTKQLPVEDNSVVAFCSCVLEYVDDADKAIGEITRVSGGEAFYVGVEPWTVAAYFYPGAKRTLPGRYR